MSLERYNPVEKLQNIRLQIEELNRSLGTDEKLGDWVPALDVFEDEDRFLIFLDTPGIHINDLEISVEENTLHINGYRNLPYPPLAGGERKQGHFHRSVRLGDKLKLGEETASLKNGVLEVSIPKPKKSQKKKGKK